MAGSNTKVLSLEELKKLNDMYVFTFTDNNVLVKKKTRRTLTAHPTDSSFSIVTFIGRKVTISKQAIELWIKKYSTRHTLFDVQNAMNILSVTYQKLTEENIDNKLKNMYDNSIKSI